ncbi:FAD-binding domain-containing protein [Corynespora cassiicola Philippines]|uniref:FAD-binding domain-containing protein n=1 Tax=Corynespora cassiicola Philippines TaxID=1448308 RepID=A0A2T2N7D6_CORCC|nr:FAD-binding domain-containing protein [Corynespora cassiicola Philippines]
MRRLRLFLVLPTTATSLVSSITKNLPAFDTNILAEVLVPQKIAAGAELFEYERKQLTDGVISRISDTRKYCDVAKLLRFASEPSPPKGELAECKTFPDDNSWPRESEWGALNDLLGSNLITTVPIASVCYETEWGTKDSGKCHSLVDNFNKPDTHEQHPTSIMWPIFQGKTCMARTDASISDTCTLGGFPAYAVNVSTVAQIQSAVNFARNTNIRLVIKNTGHCYLGKSSGAGSLSVWTHNLKEIKFLPEYNTTGYYGKAFKAAAGVTVREMYQAADANNVSVQGAISPTVGYVGGYLQGGGHNPLSGYYGMAADSVLAYEVVTADGRFVTASEDSYPDLFWALRGGGGGTYGIVTSAIFKAHPRIDVTYSTFVLGNSSDGTQLVSRENFFKAVRTFWDLFPTMTDAGTYSFFFIFNTDGQLTLDMRTFFAPGHTPESYLNLTKPLWDIVEELKIPFIKPRNTTYYDSFYSAYSDTWGKSAFPLGHANSLPGNRLIPKSSWTDKTKAQKTWQTLRAHVENGRHFGIYHQAPQNRQNVDNAVSSAWRNVQCFFITASPRFAANASAEIIAGANKVLNEEILQPWRDITPASEGGGTYLNEAAVDEPNWQEDFYGEQYSRLLVVKNKYDPSGLFYAITAVGSAEWEIRDVEMGVKTQNGKLCRKKKKELPCMKHFSRK